MKVSDFQRKRSLMNTADFPFSYNKTRAPMRKECGVYCFSMLSDMSTLCKLEAHARSALVIADAIMQPSAEILNTGQLERRLSKRAWMRHAAPTGHSLSLFAIANFVLPLFLLFCARQRIPTNAALARALPSRGLRFLSRNVKSPSMKA